MVEYKTNLQQPALFTRSFITQLLGLVVVSALAVYATIISDKEMKKIVPETHSWASVNNLKPSGTSGFYQLLQDIYQTHHPLTTRRKVLLWRTNYRLLKERCRGTGQTLIIVSPDEYFQDSQIENLLAWVKKGNNLVYLDSFQFSGNRKLLNGLGLTNLSLKPHLEDALSDSGQEAITGQNYYSHLRQLKLSATDALTGAPALVTVKQHSLILEKALDKGRVLLGSCPKMVNNRQLGQSEYWSNFQFLANWLASTSGDILIDEFCHGHSEGINIFLYFFHGPAGLVCGQMLLILILAVISCHNRFGATIGRSVARRISDQEHIDGLASTYQRAQARNAVLDINFQHARTRLCRTLQFPPHETNENLLAELARNENLPGFAQLRQMVEKVSNSLSNKKIESDEELRELCRFCDKICQWSNGTSGSAAS
jgi:hypothetical protein